MCLKKQRKFPFRMAGFKTVAKIGDIPDSEGRSYLVNGKMVAIFKTAEGYSAISDSCPHMGISLAGGHVEEGQVICPWHAWRFCIKDGTWLDNPSSKFKIDCYPVRVIDKKIQVLVPESTEETKEKPEET